MSRPHETPTELRDKIAALSAQLLHAKQDGRVLNEAETELYVINPLLSVLGYNTFAAIAKQSHDKLAKGYPDYTLLPNTPHEWFLEVKRLDLPLHDGEAAQAVSYAVSKGAAWAVLTNGRAWYFYRAHLQKPLNEKRVFQIDDLFAQADAPDLLGLLSHASMTSGGLDAAWKTKQQTDLVRRELLAPQSETRKFLRRIAARETGSPISDADIGRVLQTLFAAPPVDAPLPNDAAPLPIPSVTVQTAPIEIPPVSFVPDASTATPSPSTDLPPGNWKTLDELLRNYSLTTGRKPVRVLLGGTHVKPVRYWSEVAQAVVQFLSDTYGLPPLPYTLSGKGKKYLLNREPIRPDGKTMIASTKIIVSGETVYVDTHESAMAMVHNLLGFAKARNAPLDAVCVEVSPRSENEND